MHRVMGVDIETYSSVDLAEAGVYAYVEAPDFDILLISYIFDDWGEDDVKTIDCFDADPDMMAEFCEALLDPQIVKTAFNANFERTCLAKWLQKPMPPEEWRCTMVKALTLGLPGNLAGAGEALGLPPEKLKDPQGKALIQFFSKPCKPTRANGQRTRNLPQHDPAKWQLYKSYNRQDVVTEQEILRKLSIYKTPESEQELWALDQHMNDNGVALDIPMVEKIVEYDTRRRQELQEEAQELTGLKNPNSLAQLKRWLAEQGVEMTSVTKDTITEALRDPDLPDIVRRVLEIRTALGKTSVAKYSTMLVAHCQDHRLRGILQFYGANRSGRWAGRLANMTAAQTRLPVLDALPIAYFVNGDTGQKKTTRQAWDKKTIIAEEIAVIVPIPEAVLDDADYDIWGEVRPRIQEAFGQVIDAAILFGTDKPATWREGLVPSATTAGAVKQISADLYTDLLGEGGIISKVEESGYFVSGHVADIGMRAKLRGLKDGNERPLFLNSMQQAGNYTLDGSAIQFPRNGAFDKTKAHMISGDFSQLVYSIRQDITFKLFTEGVVQNTDGTIAYNLMQNDMVALRAVMRLGWEIPNPVNAMAKEKAKRFPFAVLTPTNV